MLKDNISQHSISKYIASFALILLTVIVMSGKLDVYGDKYIGASLERALIVFSVSRGLNGVISVAQGTEVSLQPGGVGVTLSPGQILDPINDLVERFSTIMLFSASSLGIQQLFLNISANIWLTTFLILIFIVLLINLWVPNKFVSIKWQKIMIMFVIVRFAVPTFAIANEGFYQLFLGDKYTKSLVKLETNVSDIKHIEETSQTVKSTNSFFNRAKDVFSSVKNSVDIKNKFDRYKKAASSISLNLVDMIVIFIVQTIIMPLLFLWLVSVMVRKTI